MHLSVKFELFLFGAVLYTAVQRSTMFLSSETLTEQVQAYIPKKRFHLINNIFFVSGQLKQQFKTTMQSVSSIELFACFQICAVMQVSCQNRHSDRKKMPCHLLILEMNAFMAQ